MQHPDEHIYAVNDYDAGKMEKFYREPAQNKIWETWAGWLGIVMRFDVSDEMAGAMFATMQRENFTNRDLVTACRWAEKNLRHFPYLSDILGCPDLARNENRRE